jgi:hypothetical protein
MYGCSASHRESDAGVGRSGLSRSKYAYLGSFSLHSDDFWVDWVDVVSKFYGLLPKSKPFGQHDGQCTDEKITSMTVQRDLGSSP